MFNKSLCYYIPNKRLPNYESIIEIASNNRWNRNVELGWLVVLGFNATLPAKVISWRSVTHMRFLAFSHQY